MVDSPLIDNRIAFVKPNKTPIWLGKIVNYEYWPIWLFYIPIGLYITYLAIKARSVTFFTSVNPCIKDSGIIRYSKFGVLAHISEAYRPHGILLKIGDNLDEVHNEFSFPLIAKPDMGERGKGVSLIHNMETLKIYATQIKQDFIIQSYCDFPNEAAIFYVRKPSEKSGKITSFTTKEFLSVKGDGHQNIKQLMSLTFRAKLQIRRQADEFLSKIPSNGEIVKIEAIGNHNRGTRFINSNHLISKEIVDVFDAISKNIPGFYYGRYDLKFKSLEDLKLGINFKIVELNGINSEPVHIYDQTTGLFSAYQDFFRHMNYMYEISEENKKNGVKRTNSFMFWKDIFFPRGNSLN
jgi:hypothetical protein